MLYSILYKSRLVPRWIAGWGFIAAIAMLIASMLPAFTDLSPAIKILLITPIAVQEMVFAVWLIVKGFNPSAIASGSAKTDTNKV